jgi:hypothetical protein
MTRFVVGDEVVIRFEKYQGRKVRVSEVQPARLYEVKVADGHVLFYAGEGLEKDKERALKTVCGNRPGNP